MKKIVAWSDGSGSKWWRFQIPFRWINTESDYYAYVSENKINEKEIKEADTIVLHNVVDTNAISEILAEREISNYSKRLVVDVDDALFVDKTNPHTKHWEVLDASFVITQTIKKADAVTCTTKSLREELLKYNKNVFVLPNYYDEEWFNVVPRKNESDMIRIGWTGGTSHYDDFMFIKPVIDEIMDTHENVKMVICGDPRFKSMLKHPNRVELVQPVDIEFYPFRLAGMALDIGIAPLADKEFNIYKSPIKWLEYSLCKIPSVTSPSVYREVTSNTAGTHAEWIEKLKLLINDKEYRKDQADFQYKRALSFNMKNHYKDWIKVYE